MEVEDAKPVGVEHTGLQSQGVNFRVSDLAASGQRIIRCLLRSAASEVPELEGTEGGSGPGRMTISLSDGPSKPPKQHCRQHQSLPSLLV